MTDIQVGEYVRTIDGYIRKVTQVNEKGSYDCLCWGAYFVDKDYKHCKGISAKKIKSHSFNIIDLIEVGDFVNGWYVDDVADKFLIFYDGVGETLMTEQKINTIVTHEQFKAMEYKVGDDEQ